MLDKVLLASPYLASEDNFTRLILSVHGSEREELRSYTALPGEQRRLVSLDMVLRVRFV